MDERKLPMSKVQKLVTGLIYLLTPFQIVLSCFSLSLHRVRYLSIITPTRCPLYLILYHFFRLQFVHIRNEKIKAPCSRRYNVSVSWTISLISVDMFLINVQRRPSSERWIHFMSQQGPIFNQR